MIYVDPRDIGAIEYAMGFKLYLHQYEYLVDGKPMPAERRTGRTTAYIILIILREGEPFNIDKPENFADEWGLVNYMGYARTFFRHEFLDVYAKLRDIGLDVRKLKNSKGEIVYE